MTVVTVFSDLELKRIRSVTTPTHTHTHTHAHARTHTHQNIILSHKIEGNLAIYNMNEILHHHASEIH